MENQPLDRILRFQQLREIFPVSRTTLWRLAQQGELKPVRLSPGAVGWSERSIREYLDQKNRKV